MGTEELAAPGLKDWEGSTLSWVSTGLARRHTGAHLVIHLEKVLSAPEVKSLQPPTAGEVLPSETSAQQKLFMPPMNNE